MKRILRWLCWGTGLIALSPYAGAAPHQVQPNPYSREELNSPLTPLRAACVELLRVLDEPGSAELHLALFRVLAEGEKIAVNPDLAPPPEDAGSRRQYWNRVRVQKVLAILRENLAEPLSLHELARKAGCSPFYLSRIFRQETGKTISMALRDLRITRAAALLREGRLNVTEVALEVGYSSLSHFSSVFREVMGCRPKDYPVSCSPAHLTIVRP